MDMKETNITIEYLGHSSFFIKGGEFSVVTDPYAGVGYDMPRRRCDYVISSHGHFDHNNFGGVDARVRVDGSMGPFTAIGCFHDDAGGAKRGADTAYCFVLDGVKFLHLGDLGERFDERTARKLDVKPDVLFVPVGGNYTINGTQAVEYARFIGAKLTVAMHFACRGCKIDISDESEFVRVVGGAERLPSEFVLTKELLSGPQRFVVCERATV